MKRRVPKHNFPQRPVRSPRRRRRFTRLLVEPLEDRTMLSVLVVNNGTDAPVSNELSLRQAIALANADAAAGTSDTITFDPSLGSSTINLTQGQLELSGTGTGTITIDGSSPSTPIALKAAADNCVFVVDSGVNAVFTNLTMQGNWDSDVFNAGTLTVSNAVLSGGSASHGGGIENQGTLTLSNVTLTSNSASISGGAIDSTGTLTVNDSTFTSNAASNNAADGGAISSEGMLTVNNSTFSGNHAGNFGGAIASFSAPATITGGFFTGNYANYGGVLENNAGTVTLTSDTLSSSHASQAGGAIENDSGALTLNNTTIAGSSVGYGNGGGINNNGGTVTITNSTFSSNTADTVGGAIDNGGTLTLSDATIFNNVAYSSGAGIENDGGTLSVSNATLSCNTAYGSGGGIDNNGGTLSLGNTIVAGNTGYGSAPDINGSITTDNGYNLLGTAVNNATNDPTPGPGDVFNDKPGLAALGNYGGPTQTLALLAGSPAIGAGNASATVPATDQRGLPRVVNGSLDIGAFQTQPPALVFSSLGQAAAAGQPTGAITVELEDLDGNPAPAGSGGVAVSLSSSSTGGSFSYPNGLSITGGQIVIPQGASSVTFDYTDTQPGTPTLTASAAGFASATQQETVLPAPISVTPQPTIVVGRVLSYYDVPDVRNNQNQLTITYTVYNEAADTETGVLLTTTLAPGVTIVSASQQPDQSGQNLAWSLGTIQGDDRASVTVTVSVSNPIPLQLDSGAQAFATLDAGAVSASTPAAMLSPNAIDPNLLASTPDANTTDPFIQEEAAQLDYNAQNIFNYLHTQIGYNSYTGSLRGARGTLWSSAGNALDVASLGVALLRASGVPTQYVEGTLDLTQAQELILSMFPASFQTVGYIPSGTQTSDPANDGQLLTETEDHFWFQFSTGNGWVNADPLMLGAQVGQTFTTATGTFTEVPDAMRQKTEVTLTAEVYSQAAAALVPGSNGLTDTVVLDQTFNDVDLVGRPLSIGNFINTTSLPGLSITATTNTYSPYIRLGDEAFDYSQDMIIRGQDYQEVLTNFPLASQILTGLFLNITLTGPSYSPETYQRTLLDRIGYAARQGLVPASISVDPNGAPALTEADIFTVDVLGGLQDAATEEPLQNEITKAGALLSQFTLSQSSPDISSNAIQDLFTSLTRLELVEFLAASTAEAANLAVASAVIAYSDQPRVTIFSSQVDPVAQTVAFSMDLQSESLRVIAFPGQNVSATQGFNFMRGLIDNGLEQALMPNIPGSATVGTMNILQQALAQGIPFAVLSTQNLSSVSTLQPTFRTSRVNYSP